MTTPLTSFRKNLLTLRSDTLFLLRDPSGERYATARIDEKLNEASLSFCLRTQLLKDEINIRLAAADYDYDIKALVAADVTKKPYAFAIRIGYDGDSKPALLPGSLLAIDLAGYIVGMSGIPGTFYLCATNYGVIQILGAPTVAGEALPSEVGNLQVSYVGMPQAMILSAALVDPRGVSADATHIYIVDYPSRIIKLLRSDLSYVYEIAQSSYGIAVDDNDDYIYVADAANHRIVKLLKSNLSVVSQIGEFGTGNDQFKNPSALAIDATHIYVSDYTNNRIVKRLRSDLSYVSKIGSTGAGNDQFSAPVGIAVDATHIYVADSGNHRIVKRLKSDLSYVAKIGTNGTGNDQFTNPNGIAVDATDTYVYVADTFNSRIVKRLKSDLSYDSQIGMEGTGDDQFDYPVAMAVYGTDVFVADQLNFRVHQRLRSDLSFVAIVETDDPSLYYPDTIPAYFHKYLPYGAAALILEEGDKKEMALSDYYENEFNKGILEQVNEEYASRTSYDEVHPL
jgi:hypothetical protein